jgi:hypothetical protein
MWALLTGWTLNEGLSKSRCRPGRRRPFQFDRQTIKPALACAAGGTVEPALTAASQGVSVQHAGQ